MATGAQQQLVQLPCQCGRGCGRTAATLRVGELPDGVQDMVRSGLSALRLMGGAELRGKIPKLPENGNPLAHIPADMIAGALGVVSPECISEELSDGDEEA